MNIIYTLLAGYGGYLIAKKIKFPAPAMIGSMIAVGIFNVIFDLAYMPASLKIFTQGIAGIFIGIQLRIDDVRNIKKLAKPILLLIVLLTMNTFIMGTIISIITDMDIITALLSCVAGGVTDISLVSIDMGAVTSTVALMQTSRLICTMLFFPTWIVFISKKIKHTEDEDDVEHLENNNLTTTDKQIWKLVFTIGIAFFVSYLGSLSGIPAGSLVFSMFTIMVLNSTTKLVYIEKNIRVVGQLFAGSLIGATMNRETFLGIPKLIIPIAALFLSYWLINMVYGLICSKKNYLDLKSALFASCPAGASDMALIASDVGADSAKIGLIQVVRLIYVVSIMPLLIHFYLDIFM